MLKEGLCFPVEKVLLLEAVSVPSHKALVLKKSMRVPYRERDMAQHTNNSHCTTRVEDSRMLVRMSVA